MLSKTKFDINRLKKPQSWAVIVPACLTIWALWATFNMMDRSGYAEAQVESARKTQKVALEIMARLREVGGGNLADTELQHFDLVTSAQQCADAAIIPLAKLLRGASSSGKTRKDGSVQHNQNYRLNGVRMLQIAKFIDYAEQNYASLNCTKLDIVPSTSHDIKDSWDATISLQYLEK